MDLQWTKAVSDNGYSVVEGANELRIERPRIVAMTPILRKAMEIVVKEEEAKEK